MNIQMFNEIKKIVDETNIKSIEINNFNQEKKVFYNKTHDGINLSFTKNFYEENKELVNNLLIYIIHNHKDKKLVINSGILINDKIVSEIAANKGIEEVIFGNFFYPYTLKESDYLLLKNTVKKIITDGVDDKLKYNFDSIIDYNRRKKLISFYDYNDLQKGTLFLNDKIDNEHLEYLKYISDDVKIDVKFPTNIFDIIEILTSIGKNNEVTYSIENKNNFNEELFKKNISYENFFVKTDLDKYPIKQYIEYEKILYLIVQPAQNLSPFEKFIYAYDIVKKFKEYKECKKDKMKSRMLYDILDNNYMVCVGYSKMLGDLLDKLGISNIEISVQVGLQSRKATTQLKNKYKDDWNKKEQQEKSELINEQKNYIPDSWGGHSRRMVHIVDEKYKINGLYFSDPTWDNNLEKNLYTYLIMTADEVLNSKDKFKLGISEKELFYSTTIQEFNDKLNTIISRRKNLDCKLEFEFIFRQLLDDIKELDEDFYKNLWDKYKFIQKNSTKVDDIYHLPKEVVDCLYDVSNYIVNNINNVVDGNTILKAVKNVYDNVYVDGISEDELEDIRKENFNRAEQIFSVNKFK